LSKIFDRYKQEAYSVDMNIEETLLTLGLTTEEIEIYVVLLNSGTLLPSEIASQTNVKRTYVYKICEDLLLKGLVVANNKGAKKAYSPASPDYLLSIAEKKRLEAENNKTQIESMLSLLKEKYKTVDEKPIMQVFEGIEGLKKIYKDILAEKDNLMLLRSIYDDKRPDLDSIVVSQVKKQVDNGIHVRTITPLEKSTKEVFLKYDKQNLVERHIVNTTKFDLPSQILVYKDKVAIISLKKAIVSTLIDNKDISDTFKTIFEYMWDKTTDEHQHIVSSWNQN
jgi:sugar-specific transcriptional regulator TrmB